ncbi:MAG: NAD(P)H-dependent oxidoreductase [Pseudomonadota bacterium]
MNKILAFSGSSSSKSINQNVVKVAAVVCATPATVIDIRDYPMPFYSTDLQDSDGFPENAQKIQTHFTEHQGFIISCPEYNGSMPAIFKNMIDWLSRMERKVFQDKPVALFSTSPGGNGGATNLENLAKLMPWWGAKVVGTLSIGNFFDVYDAENNTFSDAKVMEDVTNLVKALEEAL